MGRIFKDLDFSRGAAKERITDEVLSKAVLEADDGLVDAFLGGECIKKRIKRKGSGKSGGYRTILAFRSKDRAFFIHLFAKNNAENVSPQDLKDLRIYGQQLLNLSDQQLQVAIESGVLVEITNAENLSK